MRKISSLLLCLVTCLATSLLAQDSPRKTTSLNGEWQFHRDGSKEIKTVTLPTHWETHEGLKFDGIGWYEKTIELPELPVGRRLLLHFDGVATQATVYWNDVKLGEHLGAWTPFRFDVTDKLLPSPSRGEGPGVRGSEAKRKHTIKVRVDEKVGHNTQGFLPIIAPHFGGIWQGVRLIELPETYLDDLRLSVKYDSTANAFLISIPVSGTKQQIKKVETSCSVAAMHRALLEKSSKEMSITEQMQEMKKMQEDLRSQVQSSRITASETTSNFSLLENGALNTRAEAPFSIEQWSPTVPRQYSVRIKAGVDEISTLVAYRTIVTQGDQFLLNGQLLSIRGVLNWGYYPPSLAPTPTEEQWRSDLKLIKSWGFNLMKCCLWVPPKRLLEIADEEGVLLWIEYPTWHPKLTPQYQAELMREYKEFHELDRNHPSVILRSLTCETGPGADLKVIQALYDQCKKMCGGLVVDDSSWIEWNRVFDFYDDHPYGNNHTWVATLDRLKKYIANSKYGVKPLCLGEAIAADTWVPTKPMLEAIAKAKADPKQAWSLDERGYPFWVPGFFDANQKWLERIGRVCGGVVDEDRLYRDSRHSAYLMRKYQLETYRREVPNGGAVVSVMRHFPLASMGLIDYTEKPIWDREWRFNSGESCQLLTPHDRRSYWSQEQSKVQYRVSNYGSHKINDLVLGIDVGYSPVEALISLPCPSVGEKIAELPVGQSVTIGNECKLLEVQKPMKLQLDVDDQRVQADAGPKIKDGIVRLIKNQWHLWVFPKVTEEASEIIRSSKLDGTILDKLEQGAKVLIVPDGKNGSFPTRSHWFLRGGPFVNYRHPLFTNHSSFDFNSIASMLVDLQHFDLASDVIPDINYLEEIDPILILWDNHDIKEVKTHGLVFETRVGKGRLLVSALNHSGDTNAAGQWLLHTFLKHLDSGPPPRNALKPETIARMRDKLNEKKIDLVTKSWQFIPDGKNEGLKLGWEKAGFDDAAWKPIKIGQHWEGQGYNALDGWAWYRLTVDIPKDWKEVPMFWNTEGVDDAYELYVNGTKIGCGGDIPNKKTAFEDRTAHAIPRGLLKPGEKNVIVVRVYDWYGAGGIHRPMSLGNVPVGGVDILK